MTIIWKQNVEEKIEKMKKQLKSKSSFIADIAFYYLLGARTSLWACEENELAEKITEILDEYVKENKNKNKELNETVERTVQLNNKA